MTEQKMKELCGIYEKTIPEISKIEESDDFVVFLCSLISEWSRQKKLCKLDIAKIVHEAIEEAVMGEWK